MANAGSIDQNLIMDQNLIEPSFSSPWRDALLPQTVDCSTPTL